jgi:acetylornithine deacetylase/succinyl-diaminopimelate desuccinylase-like protein
MHPLLEDVDWRREGDVAIALLRDLLRFDTSNPPGDEAACANFVAERLRAAGLEPDVLTSSPGRGNVVARLSGGTEPPLLLNAHLDVVPAEPGRWTHPPFAGEVADGQVWGRGAVDMKHMAAMSVTVLGLLARSGVPLRRDVCFAGVADEENGCGQGSAWLVAHHPDKVRAGFVLGEVGGFTQYLGGAAVYPVQVAEKGVCWIRARASGTAGHGSMPREDNPVVRLSGFLGAVGRRRLPLHVSPPVERFVRELAATQGRAGRAVLPLLLNPRLSGVVTGRLIRDRAVRRSLEAILRNTASPTVLRAGGKVNVIPDTAEAELDGRIAVGSSEAEFLAELQAMAGPDIELEVLRSRQPYAAPADTPLFATIAEVIAHHHPGAIAVPSVIPGFTDAHSYAQLGMLCYGFSPVKLEPDDPSFTELFHAADERIPVAGFVAGLRMLADVVFRFCTDPGVSVEP